MENLSKYDKNGERCFRGLVSHAFIFACSIFPSSLSFHFLSLSLIALLNVSFPFSLSSNEVK